MPPEEWDELVYLVQYIFKPAKDIWEMDMDEFVFWCKGFKTISKVMGNE